MTEADNDTASVTDDARRKRIAEAAERALSEAAERRAEQERRAAEKQPEERGGQAGPDPARYGDWEKDGIVSDF